MIKQDFIIILCTCPDFDSAKKITDSLLQKKLVACVNILKECHSFFLWKGDIDQSKETLIIIKTKQLVFEMIKKIIEDIHPYEVPEIIALPVILGNEKYLGWIQETVQTRP